MACRLCPWFGVQTLVDADRHSPSECSQHHSCTSASVSHADPLNADPLLQPFQPPWVCSDFFPGSRKPASSLNGGRFGEQHLWVQVGGSAPGTRSVPSTSGRPRNSTAHVAWCGRASCDAFVRSCSMLNHVFPTQLAVTPSQATDTPHGVTRHNRHRGECALSDASPTPHHVWGRRALPLTPWRRASRARRQRRACRRWPAGG